MKTTLHLFLLPLLFIVQNANSQTPEYIHLHFDKDYYVVGESMWYKAYFLNEDTTQIASKILHLEWLTPNGNIINRQQLSIKNGYAYGDFYIPPTWSEGNYTLRVYTSWNLNFGEPFIFKKIIPIHSQLGDEALKKSVVDAKITPSPHQTDSPFLIKITPNINTADGILTIDITTTTQNGQPIATNLSMAVTDAEVIPALHKTILDTKKYYDNFTHRWTDPLQPHQQGLILSGKILNVKTSELEKSGLFSIYLAEQQFHQFSKNNNGRFTLNIPDFVGEQTLQVHHLELFSTNIPKVVVENNWTINHTTPPRLQATAQSRYYRYLYQQRIKVKQLFGVSQDIPLPPTVAVKKSYTPDRSYDIDDYITFDDMEEFMSEVLPSVKIKKSKNNDRLSLRLLNIENNKRYDQAPIYIINNYLTVNEQEVFEMDLGRVEHVDLFATIQTLKVWGPLARYGILSFDTEDGRMPESIKNKPNTITIAGLYQPRQFELQQTDAPNFNPLLYWNPMIQTDENGKAILKIPTNDTKTVYRIYAEGMSAIRTIGVGDVLVKNNDDM